jgi:hypothetical protein
LGVLKQGSPPKAALVASTVQRVWPTHAFSTTARDDAQIAVRPVGPPCIGGVGEKRDQKAMGRGKRHDTKTPDETRSEF